MESLETLSSPALPLNESLRTSHFAQNPAFRQLVSSRSHGGEPAYFHGRCCIGEIIRQIIPGDLHARRKRGGGEIPTPALQYAL